MQSTHGRIRSRDPVRHFAGQVGVGDLGPRHLDEIGRTGRQRRFGHVVGDDRTLGHDGDGGRQGTAQGGGQGNREARLGVAVGPGAAHVEGGRPDGHHVVDRGGQLSRHLRRHLRGDAGPRGQLVAPQPQADDRVRAHGRPHRLEDLAGQEEPVGAVLVVPGVGQTGEELTEQAELPGVDLHPGQTGRDGQPGRLGEAGHHGRELVVLHLLGHLTGGRVREP